MKSELKIKSPKPAKVTYPCLKRHKHSGAVVLFSSLHTGTIVAGMDDPGRYLGHHADWAPENFEPLKPGEEVILTA